MSTVMLVDGNSLTYRAFFALPTDLATASGQVTNAVFGFTSMLVNLVRDHRPDRIVVTFDRPEPTFRHRAVETYKANRDATPDLLRQQMELVRRVVDTLALPVVEAPGFEADDVIATLAERAKAAGEDVIIVTGDRDSYQLVEDPHVRVLYNRRGVSDYVLYDEEGIADRTGVTPANYVFYAALRGDPSDNLPGVPGVGEKTAAKLVNKYGTIDELFAHAADQTPKLAEALAEHEDQVRMNGQMMALVRDVDLPHETASLRVGSIDADEVAELFGFLEFSSLADRFSEAFGAYLNAPLADGDSRVLEAEVTVPANAAEAKALLRRARESAQTAPVALAADWVGEPGRSPLAGLAVVLDAAAGEVAWFAGGGTGVLAGSDDELVGLLDNAVPLVAHDAKPLLRSLLGLEVDVTGLVLDTKLAAYLLDPADTRYDLGELLGRYASAELAGDEPLPEGQLDLGGDGGDDRAKATARRALGTAALAEPMREALVARGLEKLNDEVEVPLVRVLARMEDLGVGVDRAELQALADRLVAEVAEERAAIVEAAGHEFNVNSTPQLRQVLFDELGLTPQKKTKTGFSTDAATLEKLRGEHPIIDHLLRYREVEKLRSTYGEGLLAEVAADGRIHATFNQTVARTGRLSSDQPNLHNIPVRSEEGRLFRKAFVPAEGYRLCVADYNQIELRCIAHLSGDPGLVEAFTNDDDIHAETAARIFEVDPAEVTTAQRSTAKMVSYGLAYGMEAYGLGQRLSIPTGEAQEILDAYFEGFPNVRSYMDAAVAEAREKGYTETLFGRRRQIPELASRVRAIRQAGERQAMNAGIQGLAADIFKLALVRLDAALEERGGTARLILQVHDEVVLEVPPAEEAEVTKVVEDAMVGAFDLRVPLAVNLAFGDTWADSKA
ncbi:MAG: DNA polymerase I [Microthrixaceae bacterium]